MGVIVALDQGTTSSRAVVYDESLRPVAVAQHELEQHYPRPGWVEHDPKQIWRDQAGVFGEALGRAGSAAGEVLGVGIANQRETVVAWDRETGEPAHNAIVWQDRRTAGACDELRARGLERVFTERTGLVLDAYFSGTKLGWMMTHVPRVRELAELGRLAVGTVDSWLLWKLTGGAVHATDASNASRTLLYDIHRGCWDEALCALLGVAIESLPRVVDSSGVVGEVARGLPGAGAPIAGVAGDQQAALAGQGCESAGMTKCTYGTGCFLLMHTGETARPSAHRLLSTVAWRRAGGATSYALEGGVFAGGAVVQWLRDGLGIIDEARECGELAASVADAGGVVLLPAFAGLGAPHWDQDARGTIVGLTRGTTRAHLCRAALESIAWSVGDVVDAMRADTGETIPELRVDGGAAASDVLLQIQADMLGVPVVRPADLETTALGAAVLASAGVGLSGSSGAEGERRAAGERRFEPGLGDRERALRRERWSAAVDRSRGWAGRADV